MIRYTDGENSIYTDFCFGDVIRTCVSLVKILYFLRCIDELSDFLADDRVIYFVLDSLYIVLHGFCLFLQRAREHPFSHISDHLAENSMKQVTFAEDFDPRRVERGKGPRYLDIVFKLVV